MDEASERVVNVCFTFFMRRKTRLDNYDVYLERLKLRSELEHLRQMMMCSTQQNSIKLLKMLMNETKIERELKLRNERRRQSA